MAWTCTRTLLFTKQRHSYLCYIGWRSRPDSNWLSVLDKHACYPVTLRDLVDAGGVEPPSPKGPGYSRRSVRRNNILITGFLLGQNPSERNCQVGDAGSAPAAARFQSGYAPKYTYPRCTHGLLNAPDGRLTECRDLFLRTQFPCRPEERSTGFEPVLMPSQGTVLSISTTIAGTSGRV